MKLNHIARPISIILAISMLWQEALCASPELLETRAGTSALQAPTTFQDLNINSYENTIEALLKYFTLAVPDIRSFKLRITPKIRNSSLEFNFEKIRIEDDGTIFVPCSITTNRGFITYDAVIDTENKSIRMQARAISDRPGKPVKPNPAPRETAEEKEFNDRFGPNAKGYSGVGPLSDPKTDIYGSGLVTPKIIESRPLTADVPRDIVLKAFLETSKHWISPGSIDEDEDEIESIKQILAKYNPRLVAEVAYEYITWLTRIRRQYSEMIDDDTTALPGIKDYSASYLPAKFQKEVLDALWKKAMLDKEQPPHRSKRGLFSGNVNTLRTSILELMLSMSSDIKIEFLTTIETMRTGRPFHSAKPEQQPISISEIEDAIKNMPGLRADLLSAIYNCRNNIAIGYGNNLYNFYIDKASYLDRSFTESPPQVTDYSYRWIIKAPAPGATDYPAQEILRMLAVINGMKRDYSSSIGCNDEFARKIEETLELSDDPFILKTAFMVYDRLSKVSQQFKDRRLLDLCRKAVRGVGDIRDRCWIINELLSYNETRREDAIFSGELYDLACKNASADYMRMYAKSYEESAGRPLVKELTKIALGDASGQPNWFSAFIKILCKDTTGEVNPALIIPAGMVAAAAALAWLHAPSLLTWFTMAVLSVAMTAIFSIQGDSSSTGPGPSITKEKSSLTERVKVLVLCSHNMERSPLVARILSINTPEDLEGELDITSGSIYKLPDADYAWEYRSRDSVLSGHAPYRATRDDLKSADLIFVMTNDHIKDLLKKYPELDLKNKTFLLLGDEELRLDTDGDYPEPDSLYMHSKIPYQALRNKITSKENLDKIFAQIRSVAAKRHESFAGGGSPVASIRGMVKDIYLENNKQRRRMTLTEYCDTVRRMIPVQDDGSIASVYLDGYPDIESCVRAYLLDFIRPPRVIIDAIESHARGYSPNRRIRNIRTTETGEKRFYWHITTKRAKFLVIEMLAKQLGKYPVELIATDYKITRIAELGGRKIFSLLRWAKKEFNTANLKETVLALNKHLGIIDKRLKAVKNWTRTRRILANRHPSLVMGLPGTTDAIMREMLSNDEIDALAIDAKGGEHIAPNKASEQILTQLAEIELGDASKSFRRKFKLSVEEVCEIIPYKSVLKTCIKKFRRASSEHNNATFKTYLYYSLKFVIRTAATHSEKWNKERQAPDFVFDDNQYKKYMDADKDDGKSDETDETSDKNALISLLQRETGCSKRDAEIFYDITIAGVPVVRCGLNNGIAKQRISRIVIEAWGGIADNPYLRPMFDKNDKLRKEIEKADKRNQQKKEIAIIRDALALTWTAYTVEIGHKPGTNVLVNPASNLIKARALYRANAPKRLKGICIALDIEIAELGAMIGIKPSDIEKIRSGKDVYIDYNAMMAANDIYRKRSREILRSLRGTPANAEFWKLISPTHPLPQTQIRGILRKQYIPLWVMVRARESAGGTATHANAIEKPFVSPQITDDPEEDLPDTGLSRGLRGTRPAFMKTPKERLKGFGKAQQAKPVEYIATQVKPIHEEPSIQTVPEETPTTLTPTFLENLILQSMNRERGFLSNLFMSKKKVALEVAEYITLRAAPDEQKALWDEMKARIAKIARETSGQTSELDEIIKMTYGYIRHFSRRGFFAKSGMLLAGAAFGPQIAAAQTATSAFFPASGGITKFTNLLSAAHWRRGEYAMAIACEAWYRGTKKAIDELQATIPGFATEYEQGFEDSLMYETLDLRKGITGGFSDYGKLVRDFPNRYGLGMSKAQFDQEVQLHLLGRRDWNTMLINVYKNGMSNTAQKTTKSQDAMEATAKPARQPNIDSSQSGLGQEDTLRLRNLTKPDETIKNFFETVISILLSGKKLKLIFEDGIGSSQWSRVLAIITKLQALMADKNWPLARLLKNLEVKIVPAEKIPYLLRDMDRDENTEVFVFARQSKRKMFMNMSENKSIHVPNPEDAAHTVYIDETDFYGRARYPLMEIITLTIVKYHNNYSVEEVVESLNNEGITLDKLNLADIINKDGDGNEVPYLLFKLLPRAKELETQELLKTNGLYKEFMAAA